MTHEDGVLRRLDCSGFELKKCVKLAELQTMVMWHNLADAVTGGVSNSLGYPPTPHRDAP